MLDTPLGAGTAGAAADSRRGEALRIEVVRELAGLACHADAWDQLALAAPQRLPMLSHAWVASFLEHCLGPRQSWWCVFAYAGDALVGVLPVVAVPHRLLGRWRPLLRTPWDPHTLTGDMLLAAGWEAVALPALLAALARAAPRRLGVVLRGVREGSPTLAALARGLSGTVVIRAFDTGGSFVRLDGTVEEFRARLGTKMRNNLKRSRQRLSRHAPVEARFLTDATGTGEAFARFLELEASGWKGRQGTALARSPRLVAFYAALARRLAARGWLEWHFLTAGGRVVAGALAVRFARSLVIPKIAYDEEFAKCAPGNLLFEQTVERAFARGDVDEINQASDMPWHRLWRMERSDYSTVWLYPRRPFALLCGALPVWTGILARRAARHRLAGRLRAWLGQRKGLPRRAWGAGRR